MSDLSVAEKGFFVSDLIEQFLIKEELYLERIKVLEDMLKDLLNTYQLERFYTGNQVHRQCSFCKWKMEDETGTHHLDCPLPGAMKWLEEMNDND